MPAALTVPRRIFPEIFRWLAFAGGIYMDNRSGQNIGNIDVHNIPKNSLDPTV